ncbi:adenylate/guanylate cyclase domain-containing protein [soil metagenome]
MPAEPQPERARQIRRLFRLGMSVDAATRAVDADRVALALLDHLIGGSREFTRTEAAARAGVDETVAQAIERVAGLADGVRYSEAEIHQLSLIGRLIQLMPDHSVIDQIRGDIPMLRTMALRTLDTAHHIFLRAAREEEDDQIELALRMNEVAGPLLDISTELIGQSYRRVVLYLLTSDIIAQAMQTDDETIDVAVGFVDVVGYTSLSARIDPTGLGEVLTAFEHSCLEMVEDHPEVQLVKFLGDAGMFVSLDPLALARGMHDLVQPIEDADQVLGYAPIRGGLSAGPTLLRGGDYFGPAANEAARLTDLARRNTVLAADHLKDQLEGAFKMRHIRPVLLHGIGMRRPFALREQV